MRPGEPAVEVDRLFVRYGAFTAVHDLSLRVMPGEIFAFLGANGAGKTSTIRVLCGLMRPTEGLVRVAGHDASGDVFPIKRAVGYMSQKFTLYSDLSVEQNLQFAGSLRRLDPSFCAKRAKEILDFVGFEQSHATIVGALPGGERQFVSLVAAMLHDPEILFLDEPTAGVAPAVRLRFWSLIGRIASEGKTIFVTTHHLEEVEQCGRVAMMREGRLVALDSADALKAKAFPDPFYELRALEGAPARWGDRVASHPSLATAACVGLRWHVSVRDDEGFRRLLAELGPRIAAKAMPPTLEDTFIRLGEGA